MSIEKIIASYTANKTTPEIRYAAAIESAKTLDAVFTLQPIAQDIDDHDATKALSGIIISIKDTFDKAGQVTKAGAIVPTLDKPSTTTATAVERLEAAGAITCGRTNMSEFAFSGLGINPHYGNPRNAIDDTRITGGSSSGGAISVTSGCCDVALGTDTGGSLRIPAAFNGLVGFKPTQQSVPTDGCFPLSPSLDCVGPIAKTVDDCRHVWEVLSDNAPCDNFVPKKKLLAPTNIVMDDLDEAISGGFYSALRHLRSQGWIIDEVPLDVLDHVIAINASGGLVLPESAWVHRELLSAHETSYDPLIASRIKLGAETELTDYIERLQQRPKLQKILAENLQDYDAVLCPTVAILPPNIESVCESEERFTHYNRLTLRNTALFNYLDSPSISLPFYAQDAALPIGLMLSGISGEDSNLLTLAKIVEITVNP